MLQPNQTPQEIPFEFKGTAAKYFSIWIVNILLMIVTLGIYAAWAKVRTNRYFYGNTLLANAPFAYLATPMAILKGWAIAIIALIVYSVVTELVPVTTLIFMAVFLIALPWIVVRAMAFRARNTAYRNIRFTFKSTYAEAAKIFIGLTLLLPLTLGLIYPYYVFAMNRFLVENSGYGTSQFSFHATARDFYKVFLKISLIMLLFIVVLVAAMMPVIKGTIDKVQELQQLEQSIDEQEMENYPQPEQMPGYEQSTTTDIYDTRDMNAGDMQPDMGNEMPANEMMSDDMLTNELPVEEMPASDATTQDMLGIEGQTGLVHEQEQIVAADEVLYDAEMEYPQGSGDMPYEEDTGVMNDEPAYVEDGMPVAEDDESVEEDNTALLAAMSALPLMLLFMFLFYLVPYAYIQAHVRNLVFNHTELAGHQFRSSLRARDLTWLYFSNSLAIMLSFGLLIPWAKIRMARYRAAKLVLLPAGDLNSFMQAEQEKVSALGEEFGDVFDVDVGL